MVSEVLQARIETEVRAAVLGYRGACERLFAGKCEPDEVFQLLADEFMAYYGIPRNGSEVVLYNCEQEKAGFLQAADAYQRIGGAPMSVPWIQVLARSDQEAIAAYEIDQIGPRSWDRALVMEVWRRDESGAWRVLRQFMEQEGRKSPLHQQMEGASEHQAAMQGLLTAHRAYYEAWNQAIQDKHVELVTCFVSPAFRGTYFMGGPTFEVLEQSAYVQGIAEAIKTMDTMARWTTEIRHLEMRSENEGVLLCRAQLSTGTAGGAGVETMMEVWRREQSTWRLYRAYEEVQ